MSCKNGISFGKDVYKEHHDIIERSSAESAQSVVSMAEEIGFTNLALWKSFMVFVLLMLSMQPESLLPSVGRGICVEAVTAADDDVLRQVCRASPFIGGNPTMDGALEATRVRSRYVCEVVSTAGCSSSRECAASHFVELSRCSLSLPRHHCFYGGHHQIQSM